MNLTFCAHGVPQPKGSTKAFLPKGWTRPIVTSDNSKNKGWQQLVAEAASQAITVDGHFQMIEGPVRLAVTFYLPRPKSLPRRVLAHVKKPDLDKLVRSVKDALSKVTWQDDSQVTQITASKAYCVSGAPPHARISVESIDESELTT